MPQDHGTVGPGAGTTPSTGGRRRLPGRLRLAGAALVVLGIGAVALDAEGAGRRRRPRLAPARTLGAGAVPSGAAASARPSSGLGRVVFATDQRAYLDRGKLDGLEAGQTVQILRGGRAIGACTVERTAEHQATCTGGRLHAGDTFRPPAARPPRAAPKGEAALPPVTATATLQERAEAVSQTAIEKVDFKGKRLFGGRTRIVITPALAIWRTQSDGGPSYALEQLDGAVQAYDVGLAGLRLDAAFSAMRWGAGSSAGRFRPDERTQFYLWQAELSRRSDAAGTVFAAGRIWPWHLPGLTLLDGVQIGRHDREGTREAGVYAGLMPTALGLGPSTDAFSAGLYGMLTEVGQPRGLFRLARQTARLGMWHTPGAGWRADVEGAGQIWLGPTSVSGGGRVRLSGGGGARPVLERAYLDFGMRPTLAFGGGLHVRYFGVGAGDVAALVGEVPANTGAVHAVADVHVDPWTWLGLAGFAGIHQERASERAVRNGAGEIRFPRLLRSFGGASAGAEIQEGWTKARVLYGQLVLRAGPAFLAMARVSASATQFQTPEAATNLHELGGSLNLDGPLAGWLRLRAWLAFRSPWLVQGEASPAPSLGLMSGGSLTGVF